MKSEQEYKINKHILLKLQGDRTCVFIDDIELILCKKLAVNIPVVKVVNFNEIKSIDDLENINYNQIANNTNKISPETEFFVHCSNLQTWAENGYDTRLIHSNLAFPLLKRLCEVGDIPAKRIFKEEIVRRYIEGNQKVQEFLTSEEYLDLLSIEERDLILAENAQNVREIENKLGCKIRIVDSIELHKKGIELFQRQICGLGLMGSVKFFIPEDIKYFESLEKLFLHHFLDKELPEWIGNLNKLENLDLCNNKIEIIPKNIGNLKKLKILQLRDNNLKKLPESIGKLKNLEDAIFSKNQLKEFPLELCTLPILQGISLNENNIKTIPSEIKKITHLKEIDLSDNPLKTVSEELLNLPSIGLIIIPSDSDINEEKAKRKKIRIIYKKRFNKS